MATSFIILAAGLGSRLGGSVPKPLTVLEDGRTILQQQLDNITEVFGQDALRSVIVVLGHRSEEIHEVLPRQAKTVHNVDYEFTNTSKSLLQALSRVPKGNSALWLNGDVVFDADILRKARAAVEADRAFVYASMVIIDARETSGQETASVISLSGMSNTFRDDISNATAVKVNDLSNVLSVARSDGTCVKWSIVDTPDTETSEAFRANNKGKLPTIQGAPFAEGITEGSFSTVDGNVKVDLKFESGKTLNESVRLNLAGNAGGGCW